MADNITLNTNTTSGAVLATDEVTIGGSAVHAQRVKIALGASNAYDMDLDSGQQTMVNSVPVAIASNQSAVPVTDNAGSLTVDAPIGTPVNVQVGDGTNVAACQNLVGGDALRVAIVDTSGTHVQSFGSKEYQENTGVPVAPYGTVNLMDAVTTTALEATAGSWVAGRATRYGAALVQLTNSSGALVDTLPVSGSVTIGAAIDTELPAAALLADNAATPTAPAVGAFGMVYDGATWDLLRGTAADGMLVNLGANNDVTLGAALPAGTNNIGDVDVLSLPALPAGTNNIGDVDVLSLPAIPAGTNNIGDVDVLTMPGTAAEAAALPAVFHVVAGDDGVDTQPIQLSAAGDLKVTLDSETVALAAGTNNIGDVDVLTMPATAAEAAALPAVFVVVAADDGTDTQPLQLTAAGNLKTDLTTIAGTAAVTGSGNATGALRVELANNGTGQIAAITTSVTPGTAAGNLGKAEDAAHATGDTGVMALGVRNDSTAQTSLTGTDGDYSPLATDLKGNQLVVGNLPNDAVDVGNPVKVGARASDYHPDTSDEVSGARSEVSAADDRADIATNRRGEIIEGVNGYWFTLDNVSTTYNNTTTTATSTGKECWNYRWASISFNLDSTLTPTDIIFEVEVSLNNGTNYAKLYNGPLGLWVYDDTAVATAKDICLSFPIACTHIRLKVTATGTDATNTFTVASAVLYLRN